MPKKRRPTGENPTPSGQMNKKTGPFSGPALILDEGVQVVDACRPFAAVCENVLTLYCRTPGAE